MTIGPSLGTPLRIPGADVVDIGTGSSNSRKPSSDPAPGNRREREELRDKSITPRWTRKEGKTLSEKTGTWLVEGIGKGGGSMEPNRIVIACIKNSAFLKQYMADVVS